MTIKHSYASGSPIDQHHILPSNYPSRHALAVSDGHLRNRQPLTVSAGNSQLQILAGISTYNGSKLRSHPRPVTTQSRYAHRSAKNAAQLRREELRHLKHVRQTKNPISDQPQYRAYRQRQAQEGKREDQKWPDVLEESFLDALIDVPALGKRKFSYRGKPHGRNELIQEYIWLAYCQSLPPGQPPDQLMRRSRKQVSSHIQVLKHFLKGTPALDRLFPKKLGPKNGFEDNFKSDPTLRALSENRLPAHRVYKYESVNQSSPMRPALFWIKMTSCHAPTEFGERYEATEMYSAGLLAHKYTCLTNQGLRTNLESIDDWRSRFPYLANLHAMDELECDIIHMDVALGLTATHAPEGSDLIGRITMSIPGRELSDCVWQSVTTLTRPSELLRDPSVDPALEAIAVPTEVLAVSETETQLKVPFPANAWAHTFTSLTNIQLALEERKNMALHKLHSDLHVPSVRHCVEQISMYQEIESRSGPSVPFIKRAILLWTFRKARVGEAGTTIWRYLDPPPPRDAVMSPPVPLAQHELAGMNENFNTWHDTPMQLQSNMLDPFVQDMGTPATHSHSAGLQSPFQHMSTTAYKYHTPSFALLNDGMSFVSESRTLDSESTTLVDAESQHQAIDHYLAGASAHVGLEYGDEHVGGNWQLGSTVTDNGLEEWAGYTIAPATTPVLNWENDGQARDEGSGDGDWGDLRGDESASHHQYGRNEGGTHGHDIWMDGSTHQTQHDWEDGARPMSKHSQSFIEQHVGTDLHVHTPIKHSLSFIEYTFDQPTHHHTPTKHSGSFVDCFPNNITIAAPTPIKHTHSFISQNFDQHTHSQPLTPIKHSDSFLSQQQQQVLHEQRGSNPHSPLKRSTSFLEQQIGVHLPASSPVKPPHPSIEQTLEQKLAPFLSHGSSTSESGGFVEVDEGGSVSLPDMGDGMGEDGEESGTQETRGTREYEDLEGDEVDVSGGNDEICGESAGVEDGDVIMGISKEQGWVVVEEGFEYDELVS